MLKRWLRGEGKRSSTVSTASGHAGSSSSDAINGTAASSLAASRQHIDRTDSKPDHKKRSSIWSRSIAIVAGSFILAGALGIESTTEAEASVNIGEGSGVGNSGSGVSHSAWAWHVQRPVGNHSAFERAYLQMGYVGGGVNAQGVPPNMWRQLFQHESSAFRNTCLNTDNETSFVAWTSNHTAPRSPSLARNVYIPAGPWVNTTSITPSPRTTTNPNGLPGEYWNTYRDNSNLWNSGNIDFICVDELDLERSIERSFYQYRYSSSQSTSERNSREFNGVVSKTVGITPETSHSDLRGQSQSLSTAYNQLLAEIEDGQHDNRSFNQIALMLESAVRASHNSEASIDLSAHNISVLSSEGGGGVLNWNTREAEASIEIRDMEDRTQHQYQRRQWTCEFSGPSSNSNSQLTTPNGRTISYFTSTQNASNDRMRDYRSPLSSHTQRFSNANCSSGSWRNISSPSDDVDRYISPRSPQYRSSEFVSHWQSMGAVCNAEGMRSARHAADSEMRSGAVHVFNESALGSAARDDNIFVYAQTPKNTNSVTKYWGNPDHRNSALAATGQRAFYENDCVGVPGISTEGPDSSNPSGSNPNNPPNNSADLVCRPDEFVHAVGDGNRYSMNFLNGANNPPSGVNNSSDDSNFYFGPGSSGNDGNATNALSFVRDNSYNQISLQPAVADASRSSAIQTINNSGNPVSTIVERWSGGTPGVVPNTGSTFTFAPGTGASGRDGGNMFNGDGSDTTALSRTVAQIDRPENLFRAASNWASESGRPETLAFSWNYEARPNVYMPVRHWPNADRVWSRSNLDARTTPDTSYNTGNRVNSNGVRYARDGSIEIRCYTTFNDGSNYNGDLELDTSAYENGDSIQDVMDHGSSNGSGSALANAPWNLEIDFSRQVGER